VRLGKASVKRMLRSLTAKEFIEWELYARLEPFNELRADYRAASIATVLANIYRGRGQRAYSLEDFRLQFEEQEPQKVTQTPEQQEMRMRILMGVPIDMPLPPPIPWDELEKQ